MIGRKLAIPVAALLTFTGVVGAGYQPGQAHAAKAADSYSGTIAWTDNAFPDGTIYGGAYGNTVTDADIQTPMVAYTLFLDNNTNWVPELATVVPTSANGGLKTVGGNTVETVHLKPGMKWSNGSPITNADYVFAVAELLSPEWGQSAQIVQYKSITFSGNDMVITYNGPYAPALFYGTPNPSPLEYFEAKYGATIPASMLTSYDAATFKAYYASAAYKGSPLQKVNTGNLNDNYNSTKDVWGGPYMLKEWTTDQRVVEVANPNFTALTADPAHPRPAEIQFVIVTESGTQYALDMKADSTYNSIDLAEDFRIADLATISQSKYKVIVQPAQSFSHIELNVDAPALKDVRVRQALQAAIDKPLYLQALFQGQPIDKALASKLALNTVIQGSSSFSSNTSTPSLYNPAKAKQLLAAAGYATSLTAPGKHLLIEYTIFPSANRLRSASIIQKFWAQIGVNMKQVYVPASGPNAEFAPYNDGGVTYHRRFQAIEFGFSGNADPDQLEFNIDPGEIPSASVPQGQNFAGINDPKLVDYFLKARATLDVTQRKKIYADMQAYFIQQAYWILLYTVPNVEIYKGTIGNFKPNPNQQGNLWNSYSWYKTTGYTAQVS
jgi:peptide/nickel transport system substrate-binding protein